MKKETSDDLKEEPGDNNKKQKQAKSKKQEKVASPAKPKRITRKSLKTLPDESPKKIRKQAKPKSISTNMTERPAKKPGKKQSATKRDSEGVGRTATENIDGVGAKRNRRATRLAVQKAS